MIIKEKGERGEISRREFLTDAAMVVGGAVAAAGITYPLAACQDTELVTTKTVESTTTVAGPGTTKTVETEKYVCPWCSTNFDTAGALEAHIKATHIGKVWGGHLFGYY